MPAQVTVNVNVQENGATKILGEIDKLVQKLNGQKIKITVDAPTQQLNQLQNIASGLTGTGTAATQASAAVSNYGRLLKSTVTEVNGVENKWTESYKKDVLTQIDVTRKLTKEGTDYTVKTTKNYEALRKSVERQAEEFEKHTQREQAATEKQFSAIEKSAEKAANTELALTQKVFAERKQVREAEQRAETDAADKRLATYGRIAKVAATAFLIKETKEALSTMKDVDQELANIQKVTDETDAVIKKLGETAYDTASKYGVSANEYLSAAAEFAKAGYSNYADLSELAIKTKLVGDVSSDVAAKFLLSADAAYKMGGNIDKLSTVLDRANVIENNYATSIYKLAEGLPIVASTASMANMSIDETMAALGTITAKTQETGRKAATALRALILNIEGEIGTVIDEETTITQESVESMADALRKYGNEAVRAAQKTGQLVDPMEAVRSLAEAYANGDLSDQGLFDILKGLGGKLRVNQITTLVKNFDTFEGMLEKVQDAAGSADREIATMLGTWNAKLEQLENTWTKLVSHVLNSDTIKGGIDFLRDALNGLDSILRNPLGESAAKAAVATTAFLKLANVFETIKKSSIGVAISKQIANVLGDVKGLTGAVEALKVMFSSLNAVSLATLAGELMMLWNIVEKRGEIAKDPFMYQYNIPTSEISSFGRQTDSILGQNAGDVSAQVAALTAHVEKYHDIYVRLKEGLANGGNAEYFQNEFGFSLTKFLQDYDLALDLIDSFEPLLNKTEEDTEGVADGFQGIAEAADEATKAIQAFADATATTKSGNADAYRTAYQSFLEDYKAGKTDTNVVRAAADMFLTPEMQKALGYNLQAMGEVLASDLYQGIYNGASGNAGVDFVNYMADNMTEALDEIVNITQGADGAYNFEYASAEKLAEYFNLPLGAIQALIGALDEFGVQAGIGWEDADKYAEALGLVGENAGKSTTSLQDIADSIVAMGKTDPVEISKIFSALKEGGYLEGVLGDFTPEAIGEAISNALKGAEEALSEATPDYDTSKVKEAAEDIAAIPDSQEKTVNIIVTGLEDINGLKAWLETSPGNFSVKVNDDGSIEILNGKASALEEYLSGMEEGTYAITVNDDGSINVVKVDAQHLDQDLADLQNPYVVKVSDNHTLTDLDGKAVDLSSVLQEVEGEHPATVSAEVTGTDETKALADEEARIESKDVTTNADTTGQERVSALASLWDSIQSKSVTISATVHYSSSGELHGGSGGTFASGTKYAPGGMALVNELGPELISDNGKAYIANGGKPAIVNLGKGAIVLTAEETQQALGNSQINNGIDAFAFGSMKVMSDGGSNSYKPTRGNGGTGASGVTNNGKSQWQEYWEDPNKKKSSSDSSSSSSSDNPWDDKEKKLKEELDALEELAKWYHNQKKHTEEGNTYADAIKKVDALRSEYLKAGFAETSKEVTTLANKIFDYEKDIAEAKAHAIDDLEDELDNLESQIELAENQGDLNRMLELQNEAQKKVAQLIEAYRAAGFSDTSPEILKLANMGYDYASDSGSTMKDLWKNLIDAIEDMRDTQDDANELAEKQLAVDEAREALTNAQNQRTVRIFNPVTGQWEWVADAKSVKQAQESLTNAEQALLKEQQSQELNALKKAMENGGSLSDVTIGPGLSALLSGASLEQTDAFASALGLLSGGFASTADTSSKSIFDSVDSHDNVTQYTFNGVTIDAATAESTTLAQLTQMITPLALTNNMPA